MDAILSAVENVLTLVAGVFIAGIAVLVSAEALTRYAFGSALTGSDIYVQSYLAPAAAFFALAGAARMHRHIGVTIFVDRLPRRARLLILALGALLTVVVFAMITYEGAVRTIDSFASHAASNSQISLPPWLAYLCVPIGSGFFCLRMLLTPLLWAVDGSAAVGLAQQHADSGQAVASPDKRNGF